MSDETTRARLLKNGEDDRTAHPWRYYKLDHDTMKRLLNEQAETVTRLDSDLGWVRAQRDAERKEAERLTAALAAKDAEIARLQQALATSERSLSWAYDELLRLAPETPKETP